MNTIPILKQLGDQKLGISALCQSFVLALELSRNHLFLLHGSVFHSALNDSNRVVLENEILHTTHDNLEKLRHQLCSLLFLDMRFESQTFPEFL